ncbi:tetratricopeptide repeat protein [Nocardia pneumoniae]|uniref:tetratricopeptide repeat protein n=1 Tax=Nocardia pneumoniae TaxID=228601 RepID=UPI0002FA697C|nr:tetratricopeptide repeat protein [Nocardia pneumoniae]
MAERLALVVGTECERLPHLGFPADLAGRLHTALTADGHWLPVDGAGPLLNPTAAQLKSTVKAAFRSAGKANATLLLAFVGHGLTVDDDFYLLAHDSPGVPTEEEPLDSDNSMNLVSVVKEHYANARFLDGLIVLVDACEAGAGVLGAGQRWLNILERTDGRMELLVASGAGSAYSGCFTRTLLTTFDNGLPSRGTNLLCGDVRDPIAHACPFQTPRYLSFNGAQADPEDRGLWLLPNVARNRDAVRGRPATGLVDHLLRKVVASPAVLDTITTMVESGGDRLQAVVGPAGSGKSTLLALLIRPDTLTEPVSFTADFVSAAVFLDVASTVESMCREIVAQLSVRFGSVFDQARRAVVDELTDHDQFDALEIELLRPLHKMPRTRRVRIIVDGLDQPAPGGRDGILAAIHSLTTDDRLRHVRVVIGVRSGTGVEEREELAHAHIFPVEPPRIAEILDELSGSDVEIPAALSLDGHEVAGLGGWLLPRLVGEIDWRQAGAAANGDLDSLVRYRIRTTLDRQPATPSAISALAGLLAAVGVGPVAPIRLVAAAMTELGHGVSLPLLRTTLVDLGILVARGQPGRDDERIGLTHEAFTGPLTAATTETLPQVTAHAALASALGALTGPDIDDYAYTAAPRHHLAAGYPERAIAFLDRVDSGRRARDNRVSWAGWHTAFEAALAPDDPHLFTVRARLARWTGDAGDPHAARDMYAALVARCTETFGPEHPRTLEYRVQLANWIGQLGESERAVAMLTELLPLQSAVSDPDDPAVLRIRADLGFWTGQTGDIAGACRRYAEFLPDLGRVLGPEHPYVLRCRDQYARFVGLSGDPAGARQILDDLVPLCLSVLGPEHNDTLWARANQAWWTGVAGDADAAVALLREVLADREDISGVEHPATLVTTNNLAYWYGMSGHPEPARDLLARLLEVTTRLYGADNPDTLLALEGLARWTGHAGDPASARDLYAELVIRRERRNGTDDAETAKARAELAFWTANAE